MANPLSGFFNRGNHNQHNAQFNNFTSLINQFQQFRNNFRGNPEQIVQELRRSGKMSEAQFQQLSNMANQLQNVIK